MVSTLVLENPKVKISVRIIAFFSTILGTIAFYRLSDPASHSPLLPGAIIMSLLANMGIWLSTFSLVTPIRWIVALYLIPGTGAVSFFMLEFHPLASTAAFLFHCWLIINLLFQRRP